MLSLKWEAVEGASIQSQAAAPLLAGDTLSLSELSFAEALAELFHERQAGTLWLRRGTLEKQVLFRDGLAVYFESNIAEDSLERFLTKRGTIDAPTAFRIKSRAVELQRPVGDVLVEQGVLSPNELFKLLKLSMGAAILDAFRITEGELKFDPDARETAGKNSTQGEHRAAHCARRLFLCSV